MALASSCTLGSAFVALPFSILILSYPTNAITLSILACVTSCGVAWLNPHSFTIGDTVMSNAPSVSRLTSIALSNTFMNTVSASGFTSSLLFILLMVLSASNIDSDLLNLLSSVSIRLSKFSELLYVML